MCSPFISVLLYLNILTEEPLTMKICINNGVDENSRLRTDIRPSLLHRAVKSCSGVSPVVFNCTHFGNFTMC